MAVSTAASTSYFSTGRFSNWWNGVLGDNLWATPTHVRHQIDMDPVAGVKKLDVMGFIQDQLNRDGGKVSASSASVSTHAHGTLTPAICTGCPFQWQYISMLVR